MSKIIKEIMEKQVEQNKYFYSIEITPGVGELVNIKSCLKKQPLFASVAWIGDLNLQNENILESPALQLVQQLKDQLPVLLHLSCFHLTEAHLDEIVQVTENFFPLTGDQSGDQIFKDAKSLVEAIKARKQSTELTIATAGYPPSNHSVEAYTRFHTGLDVLKSKVDAGANLIITQAVYEAELYLKFVKECRTIGITAEILPGLYVPNNYVMFKKMERITGAIAPFELAHALERVKDNEVEFQKIANEWVIQLIRNLLCPGNQGLCKGVHFFTMNNLEQINAVVNEIEDL